MAVRMAGRPYTGRAGQCSHVRAGAAASPLDELGVRGHVQLILVLEPARWRNTARSCSVYAVPRT
ncbi:hypothetical protein ACWET9_41760 [Streptomyces sp. NPDC004059]